MDALRSSIDESIKAHEVNRRKRVQGSYECKKRKKRREEDGSTNGVEDCTGDNESSSPTEDDGDNNVPVSWTSATTTAFCAGLSNDFVEEEEIVDELDILTEEELQAELDELEEVDIDETEDIRSRGVMMLAIPRHQHTAALGPLVPSPASSFLSLSHCSDESPPCVYVNGSLSRTPGVENSITPMMLHTSNDDTA
ncbi:unnamed protein product [Angiostrongylus costaricensis]|uniref:RNF220 domain-containing protein n=1 Tax=Angiostrongylus costaricensis TaxID=334426 RepID=A0A0R3Q195_ANGCS|nr:unnamed protein product [Angiostrongylus costaricensis]